MHFLQVAPLPIAKRMSDATVESHTKSKVFACVHDGVKTSRACVLFGQTTALHQLEAAQSVFVVEIGIDVFSEGFAERQTVQTTVFNETIDFGILTAFDSTSKATS